MTSKPKRIAILGGGVGAMTAAFWLTNTPDWKQHHQIDVYQMGWRLGGKGASGRNADIADRIEEHGLHIWFGFYANAFDMMQQVYAELGRAPGSPLATWEEAFKPQNYVCLSEHVDQAWRVWPIEMPSRPGTPGVPDASEDISGLLPALVNQTRDLLHAWAVECEQRTGQALRVKPTTVAYRADASIDVDMDDPLAVAAACQSSATDLAPNLGAGASVSSHSDLLALLRHLQQMLHATADILGDPQAWSDILRRGYLMIDMALAVVIGMLVDKVFTEGFEAINGIEFRAWLAAHGAQSSSIDSAPVRGFYDLVFAYRNGDPSQPDIEAGTLLRGMLKVGLGYRGSIMYKMQAGMGDVVFAPLYELLKRRGVRFHFFHKLRALRHDASAHCVETIELQQQVAPGAQAYIPLVDVEGLPCWPAEPLYEQLPPQQAALLKTNRVNLESHWSDWPELYRRHFGEALPSKTLRRGEDFDQAVFGLSVASLADVAAPLLQASEPLRRCGEQVKTAATQAYQVWMHPDLAGLGWTYPGQDAEEPVLSGFTEPLDTWAPMDQLLCRESWPAANRPQNVSYFCSTLAVQSFPPASDHDFPARCGAQVKVAAIAQLDNEIGALWTNVPAEGFAWQWLVDADGRRGVARFDAQFWRANIDPSERYVLSVTGSSRHRLRTDESGFYNLFLAGDWLKTGLDAGCVEAAVMGGMQASRAISGRPRTISGEHGW